MKSLGQNPTESELQRMILSVDDNGDNEIDFEEFLILMSSSKPTKEDPDRELKDAFKVFDTDGSGSISRSEMKKLMKKLGQTLSDAELDAMMDEVDTDKNGEIDFVKAKFCFTGPNGGPLCLFWSLIFPFVISYERANLELTRSVTAEGVRILKQ